MTDWSFGATNLCSDAGFPKSLNFEQSLVLLLAASQTMKKNIKHVFVLDQWKPAYIRVPSAVKAEYSN